MGLGLEFEDAEERQCTQRLLCASVGIALFAAALCAVQIVLGNLEGRHSRVAPAVVNLAVSLALPAVGYFGALWKHRLMIRVFRTAARLVAVFQGATLVLMGLAVWSMEDLQRADASDLCSEAGGKQDYAQCVAHLLELKRRSPYLYTLWAMTTAPSTILCYYASRQCSELIALLRRPIVGREEGRLEEEVRLKQDEDGANEAVE